LERLILAKDRVLDSLSTCTSWTVGDLLRESGCRKCIGIDPTDAELLLTVVLTLANGQQRVSTTVSTLNY
jgi:hypothetical protein